MGVIAKLGDVIVVDLPNVDKNCPIFFSLLFCKFIELLDFFWVFTVFYFIVFIIIITPLVIIWLS